MTNPQPIYAAIFDMDGLLIDSEPVWEAVELDVIAQLGVDISRRDALPDTLGLRIDLVVDLWFEQQPWQGPTRQEVVETIISQVIERIMQTRPLLPGVIHALACCKRLGLKIGLASASPKYMLENVLEIFNLQDDFDAVVSAQSLPYSKPHPQVYLDAAAELGVNPLHCVALEDSVNGMIASKAARMRSIVVPAAHHRDDPRWSLADIKLNALTDIDQEKLTGQR